MNILRNPPIVYTPNKTLRFIGCLKQKVANKTGLNLKTEPLTLNHSEEKGLLGTRIQVPAKRDICFLFHNKTSNCIF